WSSDVCSSDLKKSLSSKTGSIVTLIYFVESVSVLFLNKDGSSPRMRSHHFLTDSAQEHLVHNLLIRGLDACDQLLMCYNHLLLHHRCGLFFLAYQSNNSLR